MNEGDKRGEEISQLIKKYKFSIYDLTYTAPNALVQLLPIKSGLLKVSLQGLFLLLYQRMIFYANSKTCVIIEKTFVSSV